MPAPVVLKGKSEDQANITIPNIGEEFVRKLHVYELPECRSEDTVQGVKVCGQTLLEITGNKLLKVSWERHGLHLTVPKGAVPSGVTVRVGAKAILAGKFELLEDAQLVSANYLLGVCQ